MKRIFLLLLLALAACGPVSASTAQAPLATPSADWTSIKLTQSGGFIGLSRTMEVLRNGVMHFTDERAQVNITDQLSKTDRGELSDLLAAFTFMPPSDSGKACADCFVYTLEIVSPAGTQTYEANDVTLADSGMEPLVTFLLGYMNAVLK
jgi:hypothetical protein